MIEVIDKRGNARVMIQIDKSLPRYKSGLRKGLHNSGKNVVRTVTRLIITGSRSGRTYGSHKASAAGEVPANRSGRLARSGKYLVASWHTMRVGEDVLYAKFLEFGTRNIAPRPHVIKAINDTARDTQNYLRGAVVKEAKLEGVA